MDTETLLTLTLIFFVILAVILWYRGRNLKKQVKELKKGRVKTSRWHKLLVALRLRKKEKLPHGQFKKGDINIKVYRTCKKARKKR
jgi:hypothetical protein